MVNLRRAARELRRPPLPDIFAPQGGATPVTQPGDPDFSPSATPGAQLQFPAAAGQQRVLDSQTRAQNQLQEATNAGIDVTSSEFDELRRAAQEGVTLQQPSLGEKLLGWVGAPFETVNLFIQDLLGGSEDQTTLGDYANALWGGIEDDEEFQNRTGLRPESFSESLTMFGWAPAEEFGPEAVVRGIVDFGGSMIIDPLTYVTGGLAGLGRKAAVGTGRALQRGVIDDLLRLIDDGRNLDEFGNVAAHVIDAADDVSDYTKHLARTHGSTVEKMGELLLEHQDDIARGNLDNPIVRQLMAYLGEFGPHGDNVWKNAVELGIAQRVTDDVIRPLAQRNFGAIDALALQELPVWARGGLRIGVPAFSKRLGEAAVEIPGTRGLGRKLVGNPVRKMSEGLKSISPKYAKIADAMASGRAGFDAYRPIMNGLRAGTLKPWQYHILHGELDAFKSQHFRQTVTITLRHQGAVLDELADVHGMERPEMYRMLREALEGTSDEGALLDEVVDAAGGLGQVDVVGSPAVNPEIQKAVNQAARYMRDTMNRLHDTMSQLDPKFKEKYIDGYIPHIISDEGRTIVDEFIRKAANVPYREWADAAERGEPGKGLLARLMNARGGSGRIETDLGSNRFFDRTLGRLQAQQLTDDGPMMLTENFLSELMLKNARQAAVGAGGEVTDTLATKYASVEQLNAWLKGAIEANAEAYGIHIPKGWDGKVFKDNPLDVVNEYVGAMDDTIKQWSMIRAMKMAGLVVPHSVAIDVQDVLQKMMSNIKRTSEKVPIESFQPDDVARAIREDIDANPQHYAYRSSTKKRAGSIESEGLSGGGIYNDPGPAEKFVRHPGQETIDDRVIHVFDKRRLPPAVRNPLDKAGEIGDVSGIPKGSLKPIGSYDPKIGLKSFKPTPHGTTHNVLTGKRDLVDGVPKKAIRGMVDEGMDPSDMGGTRKLYQSVEKMTPKAFRELRQAADDGLPAVVQGAGAGFSVSFVDDVPVVRYSVDPSFTPDEVDQLRERAIDQLDEAFMTGDLKGRLNHETMEALARNARDDATSDLLYTFYKRKMAALDDGAREFLGKNPGEFVETTVLADEFYNGINEFIAKYSAIRDQMGGLVQGGRHAQQLAGKESKVFEDLQKLKKAARELNERGYDEAVQVMRSVDDWTGVADLPGYIKPHELGIAGPAVEGMQIQRDIGLWLKNVARNSASVYTPEGVAAAKLATNQLLRTWRALATLPRPAFHIRNAVGAAWMNMITGVRSETYAKLGANTLKYRKALREGVADPFSVLDPDVQDVFRAMHENDILAGFVSSEFRAPLDIGEKQSRVSFLNITDPDKFVATRVGGRAMETIEDMARAALFMEYYDPKVAGSAIAARDIVHAIHFDYSDLTPLETKMKSWIPFFVWTRRNLPRQLEMMVERPGMIERYRHLMQSMNDNLGGQDDQGMPTGDLFSGFAAGTNFYVNPGTPFWARVMIDPDLPTSDLANIPNPVDPGQMGEFVNNLLGPHVTTLFNIQEQREFGDVNAPAPLNTILKGLAAIGMYDETTDGEVRIPYWLRTVQETALPFSRDLVDPLTGGPTDPNRQQRLGIAEDDSGIESSLKNVLSSLGRGFGVKYNTPVDVRSTVARSQDELDKIIADLRATGALPPSSSGGGQRSALEALLSG